MKKTIVFMSLILLLAVLPIYGFAANNCPDHPDADLYFDCDDFGGEPYSVTKHKYRYEIWLCSVCHRVIEEKYGFENHNFSGMGGNNVCESCGYERPSKNDLYDEADSLIYQNNIYNHGCWVMYNGTLYSNSNNSSTKLGILAFGEGYFVNDYRKDGNNIWIQIKKNQSAEPIGWTLANILSIEQKQREGSTGLEIGRTVRITTSSGRGRANADPDSPILEYVHYNEKYIVLDAKTGTNGNAWYKIRVDGREVWISSGLGTLE